MADKKPIKSEKPKKVLLPGVELPPLEESDGQLGPYAQSGLKSVVGTRRSRASISQWYEKNRTRIASDSSPVITGYHPQLAMWLDALGGLDPRWSAEQIAMDKLPLSRVIPRVKVSSNFPPWDMPQGSYWIDYEGVTASTQKLPEQDWQLSIAERFPANSQKILGCIGDINTRMTMWKFRQQLWTHPFVEQFDAVVCPDFSSYLDDPRPQAAVGERMTHAFITMGAEHGYNIIPIISWQGKDALRRQVDLLGSLYPQVHTIYIELLSRDVHRTSWLYTRFDEIEECLSHLPFRFIFSGVDPGWSLRELHRIFPKGNFRLVTIWPWMKTNFTVGTKEQKAKTFRRNIRRLEELHRGELLPPAKPRPENMTILNWQREEEEAEAARRRVEASAETEASAEERTDAETEFDLAAENDTTANSDD